MKKNTFWLSVSVGVDDDTRDAVGQFLFQSGAVGLVEETDRLIGYFPSTINADSLRDSLMSYLSSLRSLGFKPDLRVTFDQIPNQDWNVEWKKNYHGFAVSQKIFIKPSWEPDPEEKYPCIIEIDPEMAFGTGTHETTRLCLQHLEASLRGGEFVLDIGTGTGILAIAAAKLGANCVLAFDVDPMAVTTAVKNAERNNVKNKISFFTGTVFAINPKNIHLDVILANVNRLEIIKMLPWIKNLLTLKTGLILSGILNQEKEIMETALEAAEIKILQISAENEWVAFLCVKK